MSVIVLVNNEPISDQMVKKVMKRLLVEIQEDEEDFELTKENKKFVKTEALNYLIDRTLILQEARKEGIDIDNKALMKHFEEIKLTFDSKEEWEKSLEELELEESELFEEVRKDGIVELYLLRHGLEDVDFTEKELKEFYEKNKDYIREPDKFSFYEIFFDNLESAEVIYDLLSEISVKSKVLKELSDRELEFLYHSDVSDNKVPQELLEMIEASEGEEDTFLISGDDGYYVYKIVDIKPGREVSYDEVKKELAEYLIEKAKQEKFEKIVGELLDKADIKYVDTSFLED
jgi:peptidyl-prolyl cis-trans isomerase C